MRHGQICVAILAVGVLFASVFRAQPAPDCKAWNSEDFFRAARVEGVTACVAAGGDPMARQAYSERTPLHLAAVARSSPEVIGLLLAAGAGVGARDGDGWEPLHMAYWHGAREEVAEMLLAAGADVNARTGGDLTPLC